METTSVVEGMEEPGILYDVIIAGAGPVGLFLAHELRIAKLSVLMLEKSEDTRSMLKKMPFGMRGLNVATVEALYRRGLDDIIEDLDNQSGRRAGHFAGIEFDYSNINTSRWGNRLLSPSQIKMQPVELEELEKALAERALAIGVVIKYGLDVRGFSQSDDIVTVETKSQAFHSRWLVGCDGGHSTIRKAGGFEFIGSDPEFTGYFALVDFQGQNKLPLGKYDTPDGMYSLAPSGHLMMADFDGGAFHRQSITLEHLQAVLRRISKTEASLATVHVATTWTDRTAQTTTYRMGRVLLAGDAAHIHSPLGGQGLNLGIGDAVNLGWKLAATIHGWAPDDLLDTYSQERHSIGARVLDWSRAQVATMRLNQASNALKSILRDVIATRDGATYFAERVLGLSLRYDFGVEDCHDLVGRSAPDFKLMRSGTALGVLLRSGKGVLLNFEFDATLFEASKRWNDRIEWVSDTAVEQLGLSSILVRPDGIVVWASRSVSNIDHFMVAATRWFGHVKA